MKAKEKIIVRNQTAVLKLEDVMAEHSMTLPNKFKLFDNYQVSLYMADVQGCRTLKEATAIVKCMFKPIYVRVARSGGNNETNPHLTSFFFSFRCSRFKFSINPTGKQLFCANPTGKHLFAQIGYKIIYLKFSASFQYIYYISSGLLSLLVFTIMGIILFQQRKRLKRILYRNHGTSNSLGTSVPNIQIHTDTDGYVDGNLDSARFEPDKISYPQLNPNSTPRP